jgi:lipid-binding SYLF domain-containing protein
MLGCMSPKGASPDEKRSYVRKMRNDTLRDVYAQNPNMEQKIRGAAGYAVFSNLSVKVFVVGPGYGYGILRENKTGTETFMRMGQLGAGVGMGARTMRVLFVFHDAKTLATFRDYGWQFGGDATAAAKAGDVGGSAGAQGQVSGGASLGGSGALGGDSVGLSSGAGMTVYELTESGIALSAGVAGTKYWKDAGLN